MGPFLIWLVGLTVVSLALGGIGWLCVWVPVWFILLFVLGQIS